MLLADAIEQWGVANRANLDGDDRDLLRRIWSSVRGSDLATIEVAELTAAEARRVMALFPTSDRSSIAKTLNSVAEWVAGQPKDTARSAPRTAQQGGAGRSTERVTPKNTPATRDSAADPSYSEAKDESAAKHRDEGESDDDRSARAELDAVRALRRAKRDERHGSDRTSDERADTDAELAAPGDVDEDEPADRALDENEHDQDDDDEQYEDDEYDEDEDEYDDDDEPADDGDEESEDEDDLPELIIGDAEVELDQPDESSQPRPSRPARQSAADAFTQISTSAPEPESSQAVTASRSTYIIGGVIGFMTIVAIAVIIYFLFIAS